MLAWQGVGESDGCAGAAFEVGGVEGVQRVVKTVCEMQPRATRPEFRPHRRLSPRPGRQLQPVTPVLPYRRIPASQPGVDLTPNVEAKRGPVHSDIAGSPLPGGAS